MGKATRWIRGLLGMRKDKENVDRNSNSVDKKEKKRWSFMKPSKESGPLSQIRADGADQMRSYISDSDKEQSKHAIAVAAATAAAADVAVAAAQAAAAVVRLTSQGRGDSFADGRERLAAVKIQTVFRGYLARKALRALKGLVKLQALVRGYIVRKQAAATLYSMQALIRAQVSLSSQRARRSMSNNHKPQPEMRTRKPNERFEETKSEFHSKRLSSSYDHSLSTFDESPKIVEVDTCGPKLRSRRMSSCTSEYYADQYYQVISSPLPCPTTSHRLSIHNCRHHQDFNCGLVDEDYKFATAQNTPRFVCSGRAGTPARTVCGDSFIRPYSNCPSYMANTQSFRAKLRSHSAPKQRPRVGSNKRLLNEVMASRASFSGVRMQKPNSKVEDVF